MEWTGHICTTNMFKRNGQGESNANKSINNGQNILQETQKQWAEYTAEKPRNNGQNILLRNPEAMDRIYC
jgi:hypothetical protein